jgi:hypothetical protein
LLSRFPLLGPGERVPRLTEPTERAAFEAELLRRVEKEWDKWVNVEQ